MKPRKRETGAQLLARLSSRIDLSSIDSDVFNKVPSSSSSSLSPASKIIEIYGAEGVGKTEMILHYIAKACLPSNWNGLSLPGLGAKVIIIDTEFKFSVFRLAIVLEKQILAILETLKLDNKNHDSGMMRNTASSSFVGSSVAEETDFKIGTLGLVKDSAVAESEVSDKDTHEPAASKGGDILINLSRASVDATYKLDRPSSSSHTADCHGGTTPEQSQSEKCTLLTAQEIEDLVQEALGRVQVLRVMSSDQLFISLLALEHMLSHDPLISLIVIDTVSAFYWSDKLGDLDNPGCTQAKMSPIANVISKYVSDFGVTFLLTKSALINHKRDWVGQRDKYQSGCASTSTDDHSGADRREIMLSEHVEFLGKSWLQLGKKRLVLTRSVDRVGRVTRAVACADWPGVKEFLCSDDGFQFL